MSILSMEPLKAELSFSPGIFICVSFSDVLIALAAISDLLDEFAVFSEGLGLFCYVSKFCRKNSFGRHILI